MKKISLEERIGHFPKGIIESEDFLRMLKDARESRRFSNLSAIVVDATGKGEWDVFRFLQKHVLHLGAASVATLLGEAGFGESKAIYEVLTPDYDYSQEKPDFVGVSAIQPNVPYANGWLDRARTMWPNALIVAGGAGYSFNPKVATDHGADACVAGKAEYPLIELLNRTVSARLPGENLRDAFLRSDARDVPGVYESGNPFSTVSLAPMVKDLDAVPPVDYGRIQGKTSRKIRSIRDSEGCTGDCNFCSSILLNGNKYRACSAERVVGEMRSAMRDNVKRAFLMGDDVLARPYGKIVELCDSIREAKLGMTWVAQTRISDIYNNLGKGILDNLERAGCGVLCIGVESINDDDLKSMNAFGKNSRAMSEEVLGALKKSPIEVHAMCIIKPFVKPEQRAILPFSAEDSAQGIRNYRGEVRELAEFLKEKDVRTAQFHSALPLLGTRAAKDFSDAGIVLEEVGGRAVGWDIYTGQYIVASSNPYESFKVMKEEGYDTFYSMGYILGSLKNIIKKPLGLSRKNGRKQGSYRLTGYVTERVALGTKKYKTYLNALEKGDYKFYKPGQAPVFA